MTTEILQNQTMVEVFTDTTVDIQTTEVELLVYDTGEMDVNFVYPLKGDPGDLELTTDLNNQEFDGLKVLLTAGENLDFGDLCYMNSSGIMMKASANNASTSRAVAIATQGMIANNTGEFLLTGFMDYSIWNWTVGQTLFLSQTPGEFTQSPPTTTNSIVQVLGVAIHENRVYFNPSLDILTHA